MLYSTSNIYICMLQLFENIINSNSHHINISSPIIIGIVNIGTATANTTTTTTSITIISNNHATHNIPFLWYFIEKGNNINPFEFESVLVSVDDEVHEEWMLLEEPNKYINNEKKRGKMDKVNGFLIGYSSLIKEFIFLLLYLINFNSL